MLTRVETGVVTYEQRPFVELAYSGKDLGNVDLRFGPTDEVQANQQRLLRAVGPGKLVLQSCVNEPNFLDLSCMSTSDLSDTYVTDGLFVNRSSVVLGLNPADCNGMVIYDGTEGRALGLVHVGRGGAEGGIHVAAIEHLKRLHHVPLPDVRVYFAPSIRQASYRFPTIKAEMLADPKWQGFIEARRDGTYNIDLLGRVVTEMLNEGVNPDNVEINPIDVGADPDYFSHSRSYHTGEPNGRNGIVAKLLTVT